MSVRTKLPKVQSHKLSKLLLLSQRITLISASQILFIVKAYLSGNYFVINFMMGV